MSKRFKIAVVGATGAVGETMLAILAERDFPASEVSDGKIYRGCSLCACDLFLRDRCDAHPEGR